MYPAAAATIKAVTRGRSGITDSCSSWSSVRIAESVKRAWFRVRGLLDVEGRGVRRGVGVLPVLGRVVRRGEGRGRGCGASLGGVVSWGGLGLEGVF